ncbi:LuxR C-terminal-related transcriptional regulator [Streptomyces sodiiphilus]
MHRRAASLLHREGAPSLQIAQQLLAAQSTDEWWAAPVLQSAAEQALAEDNPRLAVACLDLAYEACRDEGIRAGNRLTASAVMWRLNPAASEQLLEEPLAALHNGVLPSARVGELARLLFSHGRVGEGREVLERSSTTDDPGTRPLLTHVGGSGSWLHATPAAVADPEPAKPEALPGAPPGLLDLAGAEDDEQARITVADHALETLPLADAAFDTVVNALNSLVYADRPDLAAPWCEELMEEAARRRSPGWRALFASKRAEIAFRQGSLTETEEYALLAQNIVPGWDGGAFIGGPLAFQIMAYTAMGRHDAAAQRLSRPVPEALYKSVYGLVYRRARGHHYLATGRPHAALGEFLLAGQLAQRWGVDQPEPLPWRVDAAEAWLRLGEPQRADTLIAKQLALGGLSAPRTRGIAMRLRAAHGDPKDKESLLLFTRSVRELQRCGDRLEMSRALAGLGQVYRKQGQAGRAKSLLASARRIAKECGAEGLCVSISLAFDDRQETVEQAPRDGMAQLLSLRGAEKRPSSGKLSKSEYRVAELAVDGYTNREIASHLFITVSTVEQHLTRIYRKLNIRSRKELPSMLVGRSDIA